MITTLILFGASSAVFGVIRLVGDTLLDMEHDREITWRKGK